MPNPDLFVAPIEAQNSTGVAATVSANELSLVDGNMRINRGGYAIVAGTNSQQAVEIPADGTYTISRNDAGGQYSTNSLQRNYLEWSIVVIRASVVHRTVPASNYMRSTLIFDVYTPFTYTDDFEAGDQLNFEFWRLQTTLEAIISVVKTRTSASFRVAVGSAQVLPNNQQALVYYWQSKVLLQTRYCWMNMVLARRGRLLVQTIHYTSRGYTRTLLTG